MSDMSQVITPKSDQINAEDFLAGPSTFRIDGVSISPGTDQPVSIKLVDERRVWRPCKSMSRVLVHAWGADANAYAGRSVTLYCDPKVKWGGMEVGGIRISHMSDIDREMVMALTATKGKRAPHIVRPLVTSETSAQLTLSAAQSLIEQAPDMAKLEQAWKRKDMAPFRERLKSALDDRKAALSQVPEGRPDTEMSEGRIDEHPAMEAARNIAAEIDSCQRWDDVGAIMAGRKVAIESMPREAAAVVHAAQEAARKRLMAK